MFVENEVNQVAKPKSTKNGKTKTIEETYTKMSQLEHILLRPDTYIGSIERQTQTMWVYNEDIKKVVNRQITFVPGLYKIFDEIIVNAADNKQRDPTMNRIEVTINPDEGFVRVWNNGNGIPIVVHQEHKVYVPELIFGVLLTGSNFDDNEQKTTGGRNGFGAKLANIFSTRFIIETADKERGLKYKQEFTENMSKHNAPTISKHSGTDYTCITFYPDLSKFKMDCLDEDIVGLMAKRVFDVAGTSPPSGSRLNVYLNGSKIDIRGFEQYLGMYEGLDAPVAFAQVNDRWEIGVGISDGTFQQVSFANSICTTKGGCHVNYIADQLTAKLMGVVKKKNKGEEVRPNQIKNHLAVFVNALIVNPAFDSQTKDNLTTKVSAFGSTCVLPEKLLKQVEKSGVVDNILSWAKFKQTAELKKKSGSKRSKVVGITKLDDANNAGTAKSKDCTLILTEGDSAKALAMSGLAVVGRDYYGVFPLKGKLLNVREASHAQIMKNEEIQNITHILGLTFGKEYNDTSSLRYGHLMIMTDQDHDGSHIKGLLINFIHHFWPSLLKIPGFLQQFITPIVKCTKSSKELSFYTIPEYLQWKETNDEGKGWKIKYYKGLGTSTSAEAKEYFSNLETHQIDFEWDENANDMIDMAFAKKRVDDRKLWLLALEPGVHIDYKVDKISYDTFINHELILFSHADNERSLPHFMDGLKPSQRKVLFGCFKRNLKGEIKVAQLAGYISEHSAYHHGEASLTQTIIGMAQSYVGSNNINLLSPCGQFGTRLMGGKDAASPRYVFTKLETITRCIFHPNDDPLLDYLDEDGQSIEPTYYVPVIPMCLVNGSEGIGTGWSTSVPTYNPREIIANLRRVLKNEELVEMHPWYRGFTGAITPKTGKDSNNYSVLGNIEVIDDSTVVISELPVGKWTTDYKQFLESVMIGNTANNANKDDGPNTVPFVKEFRENHTDTTVLFTVTVPPEKLAEIQAEKGGLVKKFKLEGSIATSNMHMFDINSQMRKYESARNILMEFYNIRIMYYDRRKKYLLSKLTEEWEKLDNKMRFILAVIRGELVVSNRKKVDILNDLQIMEFKAFSEKKTNKSEESDEEETPATSIEHGYDYLLGMKIWSLTMEKVNELKAQRDTKRGELDEMATLTAEDLWERDLDNLDDALSAFEGEIQEAEKTEVAARKKAGSKSSKPKAKKPVKKARKLYSSDEDDENDDIMDDEDSEFETVQKKTVSKKTTEKPVIKAAPAKFLSQKPMEVYLKPAVAKEKPVSSAAVSQKPINENMSLFERLKLSSSATGSAANAASTSLNNRVTQSIDLISDDDAVASVPKPVIVPAKAKKAPVVSKISSKDSSSAAVKTTVVKKGTKRAPKDRSESRDMASFSPGSPPPVVTKKAKQSKPAVKESKLSKSSDVPAKTKAKAPAKTASKKKVIESDEEEEFNDEEDDEVVEVIRTPKPSRARKVTNYNNFFDEEEEEDDFIVDSDEEAEESDFSD